MTATPRKTQEPGPPCVRPAQLARLSVAVFGITAVAYAAFAAPVPFHDKGQPREALAVRDILSGEGLILPRREVTEISSKPPLFHWLAALSVRAGVRPDELAMRFPSVLFGAGGVALTAAAAASSYGMVAGILSAAVLGSSFEWLRSATQSRVDTTLTFFVLAAILAWHASLSGSEARWRVRLGYLCVACAVLAKGPVGAVLPVLVIGIAAVGGGAGARLRRLVDWPGAVGAAGVCAAWYLLAWRSGGDDFAARHLVHENLQRFVGWGEVPHAHSFAYYLPVLAGAFFPWTLALPAALWRAWQRRAAPDRFFLVWSAVVLGFFSLAAGKRSVYLLPLCPPLAILTGRELAAFVNRSVGSATRAALLVGAGVLICVGAAIWIAGPEPLIAPVTGHLSSIDRARLPATLSIIREQRLAVAIALAVLAAALAVLASRAAGHRLAGFMTIALVWSAGLTAFGTYPLAMQSTPRSSAERVRALLHPDDRLCTRGYVDFAFRYYVGRPIPPCPAGTAGSFVVVAAEGDRSGQRRFCLRRVADGQRGESICVDSPASGAPP